MTALVLGSILLLRNTVVGERGRRLCYFLDDDHLHIKRLNLYGGFHELIFLRNVMKELSHGEGLHTVLNQIKNNKKKINVEIDRFQKELFMGIIVRIYKETIASGFWQNLAQVLFIVVGN